MMPQFKAIHWLIFATFLAALASQMAGLDHWSDAIHPPFVAGIIGQIAALITAMFTKNPEQS